jgi:hypothetical protein
MHAVLEGHHQIASRFHGFGVSSMGFGRYPSGGYREGTRTRYLIVMHRSLDHNGQIDDMSQSQTTATITTNVGEDEMHDLVCLLSM